MKILHTYCLNYNIGDYALGIGVKNLLRKYLNIDLIAETNIQGREFTRYYINEVVNKKYDLLVIGGGGIIHGSHWPNAWFWLIDKELIKEIKIPFIVFGVGVNYWEDEGGIPERGVLHLKETFKHASFFSVRNDGSHNRLLNMTGINAEVVPDPGFHISLNETYERKIPEKYVIIQLANDKPLNRYGSVENQKIFISELRKLTKLLAKKYHVFFIPHVFEDIEISEAVSQNISNTSIWEFKKYAFDKSEEALGYYKFAEFVIAMRGHGQIIPIGFNTPVISLENHPKHRGLMNELDLLDYNIEISSANLENRLKEAIHNLERNKDYLIEKYKTINNQLNLNSKKFFLKVNEVLNR